MANFQPSLLVDAQIEIDKQYSNAEMRMKPSPAFGLLLGNQPLIPNAEELRLREDRAIKAYLLTRTKRTSGSARAYNHTGARGDSLAVDLNWVTKSDKFSISLKQLDNNVISFKKALANGFLQCMMNVVEDHETALIAWLMAHKSQYSAALVGDISFDANDNLLVGSSQSARFIELLKSAFRQNKYSSMLDIIADPKLFVTAEFDRNQGTSNDTNTAFQFNGVNITESIELSDANLPGGSALAMPVQSVCVLDWIPKQNREGEGDYNSYVGGFGSMQDPWGYGIDFAVHGYAQRADNSASNGDTQDVTLEFEVSLDTSNVASPLSGTNSETVVFEAGIGL